MFYSSAVLRSTFLASFCASPPSSSVSRARFLLGASEFDSGTASVGCDGASGFSTLLFEVGCAVSALVDAGLAGDALDRGVSSEGSEIASFGTWLEDMLG